MLQDSITLLDSASASNFSIASGTDLPTTGNNTGELFFLTSGDIGLHVFNGSTWDRVGSGGALDSGAIVDALGYTPAALDGSNKIVVSQVPSIAITDTSVVASQAEMLALTAQVGDVAVRTDLNKSYILKTEGASVLANWQELSASAAPAAATNIAGGAATQIPFQTAPSTTAFSTGLTYLENSNLDTLTIGRFGASSKLVGAWNFEVTNSSGLYAMTIGGSPVTTANAAGSTTIRSSQGLPYYDAGALNIIAGGTGNGGRAGNLTIRGGDLANGTNGGRAGNVAIYAGYSVQPAGMRGSISFYTHNAERFTIGGYGGWWVNGGQGTAGQVLTSNGVDTPPSWTTIETGGGGGGGTGAATDTNNVFTKAQVIAPVTLTSTGGSVAIDALQSNNFRLSLTENTTLANPTGLVDGQTINVLLVQDATGGRTVAYGTMYRFAGGDVPSVGTSPSSVNMMSCYYDATLDALICSLARGFA